MCMIKAKIDFDSKLLIIILLVSFFLNSLTVAYSLLVPRSQVFIFFAFISASWVFAATLIEKQFSFFRLALFLAFTSLFSFIIFNFSFQANIIIFVISVICDMLYLFYIRLSGKTHRRNLAADYRRDEYLKAAPKVHAAVYQSSAVSKQEPEQVASWKINLLLALELICNPLAIIFFFNTQIAGFAFLCSIIITAVSLILNIERNLRLIQTFAIFLVVASFYFSVVAVPMHLVFEIIFVFRLFQLPRIKD